jgi:RNA-binding protein YhbY
MPAQGKIQLGKQGITENFIESLKNHFKKHKILRISVLKSAREEGKKGRDQVKAYAEQLVKSLGENYRAMTIGFIIVLRRGDTKRIKR